MVQGDGPSLIPMAGIKQMALVVVVGTEFRRTSLLAALCRFKRPLLAVEA